MALSAAAAQAARRIWATLPGRFVTAPIPPLLRDVPASSARYLLLNNVSHLTRTQTRSLTSNTARKLQHKVKVSSPGNLQRTTTRNIRLVSPLHNNQSTPVFLTFSRTQWWWLFGGGVILSAATVQYMETKALTSPVVTPTESVLLSDTLTYELFRNAATMTGLKGIGPLAHNKTLVSLACKAISQNNLNTQAKAAAAWFLCLVSDLDDESRNLLDSSLNVGALASQFSSLVNNRHYEHSMRVIMSKAFSVRPPAGYTEEQKEDEEEARTDALMQSLPLLYCDLLGIAAQNRSNHAAIIRNGAVEACARLFAEASDYPIAYNFFANISTSPEGIVALAATEKKFKTFSKLLPSALFDKSSPLYHTYHSGEYLPSALGRRHNDFPAESLMSVIANIAQRDDALGEALIEQRLLSGFTTQQLDEAREWNFENAKKNVTIQKYFAGIVTAAVTGLIYGAIRGGIRNWWRRYNMSLSKAMFIGAWRAAIGAPILLLGGIAYDKILVQSTDERLFISQAIVGSALVLFALRFSFAFTPFSFLPASSAYGRVFMPRPDEGQRQYRREQLEQFQKKSRRASVAEEMD